MSYEPLLDDGALADGAVSPSSVHIWILSVIMTAEHKPICHICYWIQNLTIV